MSVVMETEMDETKSYLFNGFLIMCSVDQNDTFAELSDQRLSKIKDSSAKRQDGLQLNLEPVQSKLYLHNGCYLYYIPSYHIAKYLKRNRTADRGKVKKVSRMSYCRYMLLYHWRWRFKLNFTWSSKPGLREINEKLMWFMDIMLKYEDLKLKRYEERYEDLKFWQQ